MKIIYSLIMGFAFFLVTTSSAEFFQNLGNAVEDVGHAAGDVVRAPGRAVHHHHYYHHHKPIFSGVIMSEKWNGEHVEFAGEFAYIGEERYQVRIINCVPEGGVSIAKYVEGEQFFTYRSAGSEKQFTCKYVELE